MPDVPAVHSRSPNGTPLFEKTCPDCGSKAVVDRRKLGKRCHPCAMKAKRTHGLTSGGSTDPLYRVYSGMKARCTYPSVQAYRFYGGRGIRVCEQWSKDPQSFFSWARENGWRQGLELDRIDTNGNYCPENCRFVTHRENSQNTRRSKATPEQVRAARALMAEGVSIKDAAAQAGVSYMVAWHLKNTPDTWNNHVA